MPQPVTWLMPVLNGMPYLPQTLASIEAQSYRDFNVLVWDNGSTDGTLDVLHEWIPSRLPGRVIQGNPLPLAPSLAALVEMATTELCARIDADDLNRPDRLEKQVAFMVANPDVDLLSSWHSVIDPSGAPAGDIRRLPTAEAELLWQLHFQGVICHPAVMFRRSSVLRAGNYCLPPKIQGAHVGEDTDLWLRIALDGRIANLPEPLVAYRKHPTSTISRFGNEADLCLKASLDHILDRWIPGVPSGEWDRLFTILKSDFTAPVTKADIAILHHVARSAAGSRGKPDDFFMSTDYFRFQDNYLRSRRRRSLPVLRNIYGAMSAMKRLVRPSPQSKAGRP